MSVESVRHRLEAMLPPEFAERHEGDPFRTDTFEAGLYVAHLNYLSPFNGADFAAEEFGFARLTDTNRTLWEDDFVRFLERTGRKRLLLADGPRRLFVKGHFLAAAPALARRFPNARFLTMIRAPERRLQSAVHYLRANPLDSTLGPPPWSWLAGVIVRIEEEYCEVEQAWFRAAEGPRRCVVRFDDYVRDLPGTLTRVYAECLDAPLPAHVPLTHPPRRRTHYLLDRSLAQVGIDEAAFKAHLRAYAAWCRGE